jgi:hypothetical protein
MTVRLSIARPLPGVVGETRRVVHLFPEPQSYPGKVTSYCDQTFYSGDLEWMDQPHGMPCEQCIALSPRPEPIGP